EERDWRRAQEQREEPTDEEEDIYPAPTSPAAVIEMFDDEDLPSVNSLLAASTVRSSQRPSESSQRRQPPGLEASMATITLNSLPTHIWDPSEPWIPPTEEVLYTRSNLKEKIYEQASGPQPPMLTIVGNSLDVLAQKYCDEIDKAVLKNDFTVVLSSNRLFAREIGDAQRSYGDGIENEVLFHVFKTRILNNSAQFLVERAEGLSTLQTITSFVLAHPHPDSQPSKRTMDMKRFGAICALMLARGKMPSPLSPAVILFIIYNFNLACLTPSFIGYWYPDLWKMIKEWLLLGPDGNPASNRAYFDSHFISYHDHPVDTFGEQRNSEVHQAIAVEMLYKATLRQAIYRHSDWIAFADGFSLPCNNGFDFKK
ncbi:hypothetical protein H0H81_005175, partial [Sphagnurus paluster]